MFTKRRRGHFGLHAANNACGRLILNVLDLNFVADTMAREMAAAEHPEVPTNLHPREIPSSVWDMRKRFRQSLAGARGGQWLPAVIVRALEQQGNDVERRDEREFSFDGDEQWLVFGHSKGGGPAAVAVCGILWLDSRASAPLLVLDKRMPSSFLPREFYVLRRRTETGADRARSKGRPRHLQLRAVRVTFTEKGGKLGRDQVK